MDKKAYAQKGVILLNHPQTVPPLKFENGYVIPAHEYVRINSMATKYKNSLSKGNAIHAIVRSFLSIPSGVESNVHYQPRVVNKR